MIDELIKAIYKLTVDMGQLLQVQDDEGFLNLLTKRNDLMNEVDALKEAQPGFEYTPREIQLLKEILEMDRKFPPVLNERMAITQTQLIQAKKVKIASKKYHPYRKQISGAFIDSTK